MKDRLLSVKVVADRLDIDVQTVRRLIADGDLCLLYTSDAADE